MLGLLDEPQLMGLECLDECGAGVPLLTDVELLVAETTSGSNHLLAPGCSFKHSAIGMPTRCGQTTRAMPISIASRGTSRLMPGISSLTAPRGKVRPNLTPGNSIGQSHQFVKERLSLKLGQLAAKACKIGRTVGIACEPTFLPPPIELGLSCDFFASPLVSPSGLLSCGKFPLRRTYPSSEARKSFWRFESTGQKIGRTFRFPRP